MKKRNVYTISSNEKDRIKKQFFKGLTKRILSLKVDNKSPTRQIEIDKSLSPKSKINSPSS